MLVNAAAEQDSEITVLAFAGDMLLSGRRDGKLVSFSAGAEQLLGTLVYQHASAVGAIAASPATGNVASSPLQTGPTIVQRLQGHLRGIQREELTSAWLSALPGSDELRDEYRQRGQIVQTPEDLRTELTQRGAAGLSAVLNNGLSEDENVELMNADDPQRIVALILKGLRSRLAP